MATSWTLEKCKMVALRFSYPTAWKKAYKASYNAAIEHGWLKECTKHMTKLKGAWSSIEKCTEIAKNFNTKMEWRQKHNSSYVYAHRKRWIKECCAHMKPFGGTSQQEQELFSAVKSVSHAINGKRFTATCDKYKMKVFELDVYLPELNKGIEFDGRYWHSSESLSKRFPTWTAEEINNYHNFKDSFFADMGISVLHVKEQDWRINKHEQLQKVMNFIGVHSA